MEIEDKRINKGLSWGMLNQGDVFVMRDSDGDEWTCIKAQVGPGVFCPVGLADGNRVLDPDGRPEDYAAHTYELVNAKLVVTYG